MKIVKIHTREYKVPGSWNEMSNRQVIASLKVLYSETAPLTARIELLRILTGMSRLRMFLTSSLYLEDLFYLTDFLFDVNDLVRNPVPRYDGFYGPSDGMNNMIVAEFIFSELHYSQYKDAVTHNSADANNIALDRMIANNIALDRMIATIYRPAKRFYNRLTNPDGDIRVPYNDNVTPYYTEHVNDWPMKIKLAIFHWYEGCRAQLIHDNPEVFGGTGGDTALYGLWSVMRNIAGTVHGTIKDVEKMYVKEFLMELNELVDEARKAKSVKPNG